MFLGKGKIHYNDENGFRVTVEVGQDLSDYYSLIPLYRRPFKSKWPAHITVVRPKLEIPPRIRYWDDYEGEEVEFMYDSYVLEGNGYFFLNVWCKRLESIREELGMSIYSKYTLPPSGHIKCFHMTIGKYEQIFDC